MRRQTAVLSVKPYLGILVCASIAAVIPATFIGCATERPFIWLRELPTGSNDPNLKIQPRDAIVVHVRDQPTMTGEFVVRDDGAYMQPMLGNVNVLQRTPAEVSAELEARLQALIVKPQVTVYIARFAPARVNVVGEVKTPGVYELTRDRSVTAALAAAGWITDFAAKDKIFVVRNGDPELRVRLRVSDLTSPAPPGGQFRLRDGDVVDVE